FASGTGSNAEALIKKMQTLPSENGRVEFILSDKREAPVLEKALRLGVTGYLVEKTGDRAVHEQEILKLVDRHQIDWIFLAGYMRLISPQFLKELRLRHQGQAQMVNIHPSLLPAYPGSQAIERAFSDQVPESGVTLHLVDEGMDTGPVLRQEKLSLHGFESLSDFKARIHELEHRLYGELLENIVNKKIATSFFKEVIEC
ncbi:MAG TPA: phosphoribosylglycinamide formyltransferase, partial [Bdellovibrio sp.]|nr:phosphoribosylglycinamide formyltransferase [Bdellovibrio sp.]